MQVSENSCPLKVGNYRHEEVLMVVGSSAHWMTHHFCLRFKVSPTSSGNTTPEYAYSQRNENAQFQNYSKQRSNDTSS